ncbi:hypothetical protein [Falsiphaeobacter marinintestinus]|uniref:hypothetical protein n=1 Tax=Falsiphaeobacter marinintestinus TaxID=1492905 RepID=UPI0011B4BB04|nr:hypothetical protein [Phaeobacter marinintestinus]
MLFRTIVFAGLIAAAGCTSEVQPRIQIGQSTPEGLALAQNYCSEAQFESIDPANPPDEWYLC